MRRGARIDFAPDSLLQFKMRKKFPARLRREFARKLLDSQMFSSRIFAENG